MWMGRAAAALWFGLVLVGFAPAAIDAQAAEDPSAAAVATIEKLYAALLETMKQADTLDAAQRAAKLRPVVQDTYDLTFMAAKVLGRRGWQAITEAQREQWVQTFSDLTISTYADRFDGWSGEKLEVLSNEAGSRETWVVKTRIVPTDDEPIEIDYRMHERNGTWQIVDVYLNGTVSELALRHSEYASVLKRDGFDALSKSLETKIAEALSDAP